MPPSWDPTTYGDRFARVYDEWYGGDATPAVASLRSLAGDGPVLELGVGTGRLALPLASQGVRVVGVDASAAMVSRLRAKDGGAQVDTAVGDMAEVPFADRRFTLVFVAANTLFNLDSRAAQARCFAGAARVLRPGGRLVVEAFVPDADRLAQPDVVTVRTVEPDRVVLFASKSDVAEQRLDTAIVELREGATVRIFPARLRWAGVDELDALARDAGLTLESRWADWNGTAFHEGSDAHVSTWRVPLTTRAHPRDARA